MKCIKKWESFKYEHDASDMIHFLKKHDIEINDLECSTIFVNNDAMNDKEFNKFRFTKNMIGYNPFPFIKPEYVPFIIKYMNRFHCVVQLTKTEDIKIKYNDIGKVCDIVARYNTNSIAGAYENIHLFFNA
jgi:hypothetical protein